MQLDIQKITGSSANLKLAQFIGQTLPPDMGYRFAEFIGEKFAEQTGSKVVKAVRANQWVARGENLEKRALDQAVRETFRQSARSVYDLYHYLGNAKATDQLMVVDENTSRLMERPQFSDRGVIIAGLHTSSFDLCLQWVVPKMKNVLVLTIPNPQGARRVEFEMREQNGINLVPGSMTAIRQALRYLQQGGICLTGIDRPISDPSVFPRFFGRPSSLPVHHIFLAARAHVPVVILAAHLREDGKYQLTSSDPIEMDAHNNNREIETLRNAEKVLNIAEKFIREAPEQWTITLPVWPDVMDQASRI